MVKGEVFKEDPTTGQDSQSNNRQGPPQSYWDRKGTN